MYLTHLTSLFYLNLLFLCVIGGYACVQFKFAILPFRSVAKLLRRPVV